MRVWSLAWCTLASGMKGKLFVGHKLVTNLGERGHFSWPTSYNNPELIIVNRYSRLLIVEVKQGRQYRA